MNGTRRHRRRRRIRRYTKAGVRAAKLRDAMEDFEKTQEPSWHCCTVIDTVPSVVDSLVLEWGDLNFKGDKAGRDEFMEEVEGIRDWLFGRLGVDYAPQALQ